MLISIDTVFFSITPIPTIFTNASVGTELFILNSGADRVLYPASCSRSQILRQFPTGSLGTSAIFLTYWYKVLHK